MNIEKIFKFLGKSCQLRAVSVLDTSGTHYSLKELTLKNDFGAGMDIVRLDTETLVKLLKVLLFLILVTAAGIIISLFGSFSLSFRSL